MSCKWKLIEVLYHKLKSFCSSIKQYQNLKIYIYSPVFILLMIEMKSRLRDTIEELRRSLEPKESALEALQQSLMEKEQVCRSLTRLAFGFQNFALMLIESPACSCTWIYLPCLWMLCLYTLVTVLVLAK